MFKLRTVFWTMLFFLGASMVALQPACHNFSDKPTRKLVPSSQGSRALKMVWPIFKA